MEKNFDELIATLSISPLSIDILNEIKWYLEQQTNDSLSLFISQSLQSLFILENWAWKLFSEKSYEQYYLELFYSLASFNYKLIFNTDHIETYIKASLIIPENLQLISQTFEQIKILEDDNDPFLIAISPWFDNLSYFIHEHTEFDSSSIIIHIYQYIGYNYILTDQYKFYLAQLCHSQISQSIFTAKQLFYIKTCSFMFRMFICSKVDKHPFKGDELLNQYGNNYLQIILIHSYNVNNWSKEMLSCITHIIDLMCACCWWGTDKAIYIKILFSSEKLCYDYIQGLTRIISHEKFHEHIASQWRNDETILIDSILIFLMGALLQMKNLSCFIRSETILSNVLLIIAQKSCFDRISLCAYGILAEILSDEQLREVQIADNVCQFFFQILELAWHRPTQRCKRIPILQLLTGFLTISKNDTVQQKTIEANKIPLLIEMSDQYPITLDILWSLSFNKNIQQQLCSNQSFMNKLTVLKEECNDQKMRKIIFGILWNLELQHIDRTMSEAPMFDIMISYSHKDEILCKRIYEELSKYNYRVWIDFDQMHGNIMDAMAQAIEKSHTIIICMSEQYRKSNYCRAEAHYAFQRQLKIVPILLQEHYQPDGWLLFLIGQLLYVDFTKHEFSYAIELLIKELQVPGTQKPSSIIANEFNEDTNIVISPPLELLNYPENILDWTQIHVQNWLRGYNLKQMARLLVEFDGLSLNSLNELLMNTDPQQVLTLFQEDSHRRINENISVLELARFRTLLKEKQKSSMKIKQQVENSTTKYKFLTHCKIL